jgi:hypothetical protein
MKMTAPHELNVNNRSLKKQNTTHPVLLHRIYELEIPEEDLSGDEKDTLATSDKQ